MFFLIIIFVLHSYNLIKLAYINVTTSVFILDNFISSPAVCKENGTQNEGEFQF